MEHDSIVGTLLYMIFHNKENKNYNYIVPLFWLYRPNLLSVRKFSGVIVFDLKDGRQTGKN